MSEAQSSALIKHIPVLLQPIEDLLTKTFRNDGFKDGPIFGLDATLGSAGHSLALLDVWGAEASHDAGAPLKILGIDQDTQAIRRVETRLHALGKMHLIAEDRLRLRQCSFIDSPACPWDAEGYHFILADLGYSSDQLEGDDYGLSFQKEGPLNMQLTQLDGDVASGLTAWEILTQSSEENLAAVLHHYGEIPASRRLARSLKTAIADGKISNSTLSLASFLEKFLGYGPARKGKATIHPATKTFQALRIATNDELRKLDTFLNLAPSLLRKDGLLMIITFHSLEDRIVKKHFAGAANSQRQKIVPDETEVRINPRSRSAKLRVLRKA